jgi:ABC-type glycerol-3-phosphate transport system permease component
MKLRILYIVALLSCGFAILPPLWALYVSLSVHNETTNGFSFGNYRQIFAQDAFWGALWHSFATAMTATIVSIALGAMAAYGMTRFGGGFRRLALLVLAIRMIPSIVLVIPVYLLFRKLDILDTVSGLSAIYLTFSLPFAIWMLRGFFVAIPLDIDEAARMDGASSWTVLWRVILPIALPPILTTAVLIFCFCWNEFLFALILTDQNALTFLPLLMRFVPPEGPLYGQIFAGSTIYFAVPIIAIALIRKQLEGSFTAGSVK